MKILFLVESPVPYGANKCLIEIVKRLKGDGHSITVAGSGLGALSDWLSDLDINYISLNNSLSIYPTTKTFRDYLIFFPRLLKRLFFNVIALMKLFKVCLNFKPNIIHTNVGPCSTGFFVAKLLKIKHVWHVREYQDLDFGMKTFPSKAVFKSLLMKSEKVIFITDAISKHYGMMNEKNSTVINDGVVSEGQPLEIQKKENYFLFAGRLEPAKGIEDALIAFLEFCESDRNETKLLIAGSGDDSYLCFLQEIVSKSSHRHRVEFLGFRDDIFEVMKKSKALIVASKCEGFGLITPEAMFNGTVVIGRDSGGTSEILRDIDGNNYGYLFSSQEQLVQSMIDVSDLNEDSYNILALRAQKRSLNKYTLERNYNEIFEIYSSFLN